MLFVPLARIYNQIGCWSSNFLSKKINFEKKTNLLLTVITFFCLVPFLFTTVLPAKAKISQQTVTLLPFRLKAQDFPLWSRRFVAIVQTKGLEKSLLGTEKRPNEPAPLANGTSKDGNDKKWTTRCWRMYLRRKFRHQREEDNVWCHLWLTLDATNLKEMKHACVRDDGIGDGAKAWKLLQEGFQSLETLTVFTLVTELAQLQLEDSNDLDRFLFRGQDLLIKLQEARKAVSETLFNVLVLNGLQTSYESFVIQESFSNATVFTLMRKRQHRNSMRAQHRETRDKVVLWH